MGEQENIRHDLLAGPAFELGEEPGEGLAEHSSAIKSGSDGAEPGAESAAGAESDQEPGGAGEEGELPRDLGEEPRDPDKGAGGPIEYPSEPVYPVEYPSELPRDLGEEPRDPDKGAVGPIEAPMPHEPGTRHPVGVIYGRRVVLAWNISEGMDIFVQGKLISSEWDPNPKWFIVVWNEGRLVMKGTVFSGKQWVVKIAQKLRNAATCKARSLRVKRAAKKQRLAEGEAEGLAEGLAEHSSAIKSGSDGEPVEPRPEQEATAL